MSRESKPVLLVLASTYPRWQGDHEPGFVHELSKRLVGDFRVVVVAPGAAGALHREIMDGVEVHRFSYAPDRWQTLVSEGGITTNLRRHRWKYLLVPGFLLGMLLATLSAIRKYSPDLVHAHWLIPQGVVAAALLKTIPIRIPLVVTSHGADLYAWQAGAFLSLKRFVVRRATMLTVVSRAMIRELDSLGANAEQVELGPMGVDLRNRFMPMRSVERSRFEILFVGRLVEKKGLKHLIAAMPAILARFPEARLTIAGFGPEELERRSQADSLGLQAAVEFLGAVSQVQLPTLYRRAAVFVAPFVEASGGDRDGLGLVAVEAAACGCPIVISNFSTVRDIFSENEAIFIEPGDGDELTEAIIRLMETPALAPRVDRAALMQKFDWASVTKNYQRIFSEAQGRAP